MKKVLIFVTLLGIMCLSGCAVHVDSSDKTVTGTVEAIFDAVTFYVPADIAESAIEYLPVVNATYGTLEDKDSAKLGLVNTASVGITADAYLLTSPREYIFYVSKCSCAPSDLLTCSRDELLMCTQRADLEYVNYGRYIANTDDVQKAVMRVDFRVTDILGEQIAYNGYLGIAQINGSWYFYLSGYREADAAQLRMCFNCVRSMK